jgi:hypothetical protein
VRLLPRSPWACHFSLLGNAVLLQGAQEGVSTSSRRSDTCQDSAPRLPLPLRRLESSPTRPQNATQPVAPRTFVAPVLATIRTQKREKPKETAEFLSHYYVPAIPGRAGKAGPCNPWIRPDRDRGKFGLSGLPRKKTDVEHGKRSNH